jgi:N6-L-threonylcarbamoyladenine synthase
VFEMIAQTLDDAAGEAFDKIAKVLGFGYPGGAIIERLASEVALQNFFHYPRTKIHHDRLQFSFSGLKTAVLYDLVKRGAYDLASGPIVSKVTLELQQQVASSLLVAIADIFCDQVKAAFKRLPLVRALTFVGGVACNKYLRGRLEKACHANNKVFFVAPPQFCTDNAAMIAFVGSYKACRQEFSDLSLDVLK